MKYNATVIKHMDGGRVSWYSGDLSYADGYNNAWECGNTWHEFRKAVKESMGIVLPGVRSLEFQPISDHEEVATFCGDSPLFCVLVDGMDLYPYDPMCFSCRADASYQVSCLVEVDEIEPERITIKKV